MAERYEVRGEYLRPEEIRAARERADLAFLPLGALEWHGAHGPVGVDADQDTVDGGRSWGESTLVLTTALQPGHVPAETIAGKYFPGVSSFTSVGALSMLDCESAVTRKV